MGKWLLILALLMAGTMACNKEHFEKKIEGNYSGTFQRVSPGGIFPKQEVVLNLKNNSFSGESGNARYPAICHGSWEADGSSINFNNKCAWTADFDWTIILEGTFQYEITGKSLKMWKTSGDVSDTYELVKTN